MVMPFHVVKLAPQGTSHMETNQMVSITNCHDQKQLGMEVVMKIDSSTSCVFIHYFTYKHKV